MTNFILLLIFPASSFGIILVTCFATLGVIFICLTIYIIYATCCRYSNGSNNKVMTSYKRSNLSPKRLSTFKGHSGKGKVNSRSPKLVKTTGRRKVTPKRSTQISNRPTFLLKSKVNSLPAYLYTMKELPSIKTDKDSAPRKEVTIRTLIGINLQKSSSMSTRKSVSGSTKDSKKAKQLAVSERSKSTKSRQNNLTSLQQKGAKQNDLKKNIKMKSSIGKSKNASIAKAQVKVARM